MSACKTWSACSAPCLVRGEGVVWVIERLRGVVEAVVAAEVGRGEREEAGESGGENWRPRLASARLASPMGERGEAV